MAAWVLCCAWAALGPFTAMGAEAPGAAGADAPAAAPVEHARPLLEQLNRETQDLYRGLQGGILRVQLPRAIGSDAPADPPAQWDRYNLDPVVRQQLLERSQRDAPTTRPSQQSAPAPRQARQVGQAGPVDQASEPQAPGVLIVVPPPNAGLSNSQAQLPYTRGAAFRQSPGPANAKPVTPNTIGLVLDDKGHVLVPAYVDPEVGAGQTIRLIAPDGRAVDARWLGSDQQTELTVLQLPDPPPARKDNEPGNVIDRPIRPLAISTSRPRVGALVLYVSSSDASAHLDIWNQQAPREEGVVVAIDGQVLGIARSGQFLNASACYLIADQIIRYGAVKRATLGVIITQLDKDDPARRHRPLLGDRPAVRVDQVMRRSTAEKGGLREGDIILALAGEPVNDIPSLAAAIAARNAATTLQVLRGDAVIELTVDLQRK